MRNLAEIARIVCGHAWDNPGEWAAALGQLADLSEDQIRGLLSAIEPAAGERRERSR